VRVIFDLFGEPRSAREGERGRPEHVPTSENVRKIRALVLAGWKVAAIANEIGVSAPTLRKVYFRDLEKARAEALAQARARVIMRLEEQAAQGNVGALKTLWAIYEREALRDVPAVSQAKVAPMGKKEQRKAAAARPTGAWADLVTPGPELPN
jgi:hypothetical protein